MFNPMVYDFYLLYETCGKMYKTGFSSHNEFWEKPNPSYSKGFGISNHFNVDDIFKDFFKYHLTSSVITCSVLAFSLEEFLIYVCI